VKPIGDFTVSMSWVIAQTRLAAARRCLQPRPWPSLAPRASCRRRRAYSARPLFDQTWFTAAATHFMARV